MKLIEWRTSVGLTLWLCLCVVRCGASARALGAEGTAATRWIDPRCAQLDCSKDGPFLLGMPLVDGKKSLFFADPSGLMASADNGKTWNVVGGTIDQGLNLQHVGHVGQSLRMKDGTLVVVYLNFDEYVFEWDDANNKPKPSCKLELWSIRSTDEGKTWTDKQRLLGGYNADFMGLIETASGRLVVSVDHIDPELKRWIVCSFASDDQGKSWTQSNWIDLGGRGHHDGAMEPTVVELKDGRLMMLIRTNFDQFWKAYSDDVGLTWKVLQPSGIDASSAPAWLERLASGRLALVWNRANSDRKGPWPKVRRSTSDSAGTASWHREELSLAFSEDDGATWTKPSVLAYEDGGSLSYPYLFERSPGELWVFSRFPRKTKPYLAITLQEKDFLRD